ncbi:unnamed protein product [Schistocephalus solidus]|uniref:PIH1 domain-containing protein n=1 Tax=Schistocephalus solidus TaxID=70667 RepID=A0A183S979_SCHSO|nr:unnamed protein product [Schistocephalus solidus]
MAEINPENFAGNASSIWKMLDEMAENDPKGYEKFIKKQMEVGQGLTSRPKCRCVYKLTLQWQTWREGGASDPLCTSSILVPTVCLAIHPVVYQQHDFPLQDDSTVSSNRIGCKVDELMAVCLTFLEKEKSIFTREYAEFSRTGVLPKLRPEWSTEPHGGVEGMFKSLHYRNFNFATLAQEALSSSGLLVGKKAAGDVQAVNEPEVSLNIDKLKGPQSKRKILIEEVSARPSPPSWKLTRSHGDSMLKYSIDLPALVTLKDCELDISTVRPNSKQLITFWFCTLLNPTHKISQNMKYEALK